MAMNRQSYPSDISEEQWHFVAPYLALINVNAPQRQHDLREVFNALCWLDRAGAPRFTPADEQERSQVRAFCRAVQEATGETVKLAWADQGYTGEQAR
jgi:transposase